MRAVADPHFLGGVLTGVGPHPAHALAGQVALTPVVVLQPLVAQLLVEARADVLMNDQLFALRAFHEHVDIAWAHSAEGVGRVLQRGEALFQVEACIGIAAGGGVAGAGYDGVAHRQDGHTCAAGRAGGGAADGGIGHASSLLRETVFSNQRRTAATFSTDKTEMPLFILCWISGPTLCCKKFPTYLLR
ncbi:hypothetical protein D3C78_1225810 [compost metagenome]